MIQTQSDLKTGVSITNTNLKKYLELLSLPSDNILVGESERLTVINNLPSIVERVKPEKLKDSIYISKFIAACGAGLFDAALNFLWNEIILNLRYKVNNFGLDYFLDSIIKDPKKRSKFISDEDLKKLEDWELIEGCKNIGIITDIGYKHLDYIRDMRNFASAAHPNQNEIGGLQLSAWLQTCIKEVLSKEPSEGNIYIRQFLSNIKNNEITEEDASQIKARLKQLPKEYISALLKSVFGMYTDPNLDAKTRKNLNMIINTIWELSVNETKKEIVLIYATFAANADIKRKDFAKIFLTAVDGLKYLSEEQKSIEMDYILDTLLVAHRGYNNFINEESPARMLYKYVPETGIIPELIREKYVKTVVTCSLGNDYGISNGAKEYYMEMLSRFREQEIMDFTLLIYDIDINEKLKRNSDSGKIYLNLAKYYYSKVTDLTLKDMLEKMIKMDPSKIYLLKNDKEFGLRSKILRKKI